jgi:5-methyltetrahydropteroyltriglutamate--homocysteine methyltransferase
MYRNKEEMVPDIAAALLAEARALEASGIALLQIDEPILSTGIADIAIAKQAVELIGSSVHIPICMHVCGNLGNVLDELLKYNVNVFDFEFANNPANLDLLSRRDLNGRMIGYGCVDSTTDRIESTAEIRKRIEKGVETFDPKILLIDPDCGLRMRTREAAYAKIKYMCDAAKEVRLAL